jgi:dihydroorotate dehydrogenase
MTIRDPSFFISAPFGNWITHKNAVSVKGTFTLYPQGNRLFSVIRSLRYTKDGWRNKLGLPNPGLRSIQLPDKSPISIAETARNQFIEINDIIPKDQSIELNLSCPNIGKTLPWDYIHIFPNKKREWCIAKLSPLTTPEEIEYVLKAGFTTLHFSNTLPTKKGGLSGKTLIPYTKDLIRIVRKDFSGTPVEIIAGGGVTNEEHVIDYIQEGANHVSLGSGFLPPNYFKTTKLLKG